MVETQIQQKPCDWKIVLWQYGYWLICKDTDTGIWYNEIPLASYNEVVEACEDYSFTGLYEKCKDYYLALKRSIIFAKTYEEREQLLKELLRFVREGFKH